MGWVELSDGRDRHRVANETTERCCTQGSEMIYRCDENELREIRLDR